MKSIKPRNFSFTEFLSLPVFHVCLLILCIHHCVCVVCMCTSTHCIQTNFCTIDRRCCCNSCASRGTFFRVATIMRGSIPPHGTPVRHMELCPFLLDIHREQVEFATAAAPYKLSYVMIVCPKLPSRPIVSLT